MCAQFVLKTTANQLSLKYGIKISDDYELNLRVLPYTPSVVIVKAGELSAFQKMSFSLVPSWSKDPKVKFATHNARIETILEKPTWKTPFVSKRCLVPITEFVESIYENKYAGNMIRISEASDTLLTAAGLWDAWIDPVTKTILNSFTIITTEPPPFILEAGHDRCPVFLKEKNLDYWIDPKNKDPKSLMDFLKSENASHDFKIEIDRPLKAGWEKRK